MEAGAQVWISDNNGDEAWILAEVIRRDDNEIEVFQVDKADNKFTRPAETGGSVKYEGVELANTKLSDEEKAQGLDDDLIKLPHLHEPALLHAVAERFFELKIYTWTGPVLIAVNPFQRLKLYTTDILESYRREGLLRSQGLGDGDSSLGPHVYAVADSAYRQMMGEERNSQAVLISGESGAGKTESTKIVMLYLTTLGASSGQEEGELSVMERVLQSNPVLEAFGNGKTLRNDNSSRFGKFIDMGFSRAGHLMGAKVETYLLEKVRVAFHASGERNYHIFYQVLRGASEEQKKAWEFHDGLTNGLELPNYFHYTGQGGAPHLRGQTDEKDLEVTVKAMKTLGWSDETIAEILSIIAGILHLGQISFDVEETDGVDASVISNRKPLEIAARLMHVDEDKLETALTERLILARGTEIRTKLTPEKSIDSRDALGKTMYGAMFLWVVAQVNKSIAWENDSDIKSCCGVLDIFGFECFAVNSFEQLCINFTNEALQQQFNKFIFKMEQEEYERENIQWAFITFPDNQDCLDTIQMKKTGVLAMLDDECRLPGGNDRNYAKRMYEHYLPEKNQTVSDNTRFHATPIQKSKSIFSIRHFAGLVEYSAETAFLEKNRDEIPLTAQNMFQTAPSDLVKDIYAVQKAATEESSAAQTKGRPAKSKTVGQQFKEQLSSLISNVEKTDPHYIRCLKPNDAAKPLMLTRERLREQLRYGGVLEAVRVARMGYPVRLVHTQFYQRYRMILPSVDDSILPWSLEDGNPQDLCVKFVDLVLKDGKKQLELIESSGGKLDAKEEGISRSERIRRMQRQPKVIDFPKSDVQLGNTKVFMRKSPHDALEAHRVYHQHASATILQSWIRGMIQMRKYLIMADASITVQRFYRGYKGRERWTSLRRADAGQLLTNNLRMQLVRRSYNKKKRGAIRLQGVYRGHATRRIIATTKVQTFVRMIKKRFIYRKIRCAVLSLQCKQRVIMAKAALFELNREQKDMGKLKENNDKLKSEMASLKAMLAAQAQSAASSAERDSDMLKKQTQIELLERRIEKLEAEIEREKETVKSLEEKLRKQSESFEKEKTHMQQSHSHEMQLVEAKRQVGQLSPSQKSHKSMSPKRSNASNNNAEKKIDESVMMPVLPANYVSPEVVAEHKARVARLEEELEQERRLRREADQVIRKIQSQSSDVKVQEGEFEERLQNDTEQKSISDNYYEEDSQGASTSLSTTKEDTDVDNLNEETTANEVENDQQSQGTPEVVTAFSDEQKTDKKPSAFLLKSPSEYLPMIRRGFSLSEKKDEEELVSVGWKVEVRNRKEREELLRDEVDRFEIKMKRFNSMLEEGIDVTVWQLSRKIELGGDEKDEFGLKSTAVTVKMHRRGDLYVQAVLNFSLRGGYISKAIGRHRADKTALEPLSLYDILEVKAGCSGYDQTKLPTSSKSKAKKSQNDNKQSSLFLTIKASPTPEASFRSYIFKFKSRGARNDVLSGLRSILADMQINEGVSISHIQDNTAEEEAEQVMVPLSEVHNAINREREAYDRLLLLLLQGHEDLKEKEDELMDVGKKLDTVVKESVDKDRVQANDSKLIMQLSKKLETLLMDNEDLRDQNDRLNSRLVSVECEKMNLMGG
mmetsp:Transcript_27750/g.40963  ORF Transcript_27750/g.40963 Transcript_27750/m.40963 type:complete len:1607 (-) Transcript_27750:96-4916(-)|eukprot:CAMPEP_0194231078 /NCGR_PEP_ID=MMETSP0156-20130528/44736_1 /TAXON_ID=33649 /ORGANISM="Thalassionema nitzschioides, Strain L26-B" /LENGTH=1606 /DNA_ID=CAMNT_0038963685 /DNA_START=106 /DNA_END=4926 /DNA_ORIENTATION=+